ncbi:hypothetical protein EDC04DRAFT_2602769 [Pisolithus marmoratus]|nr:hypothetical protein EDC04DRAFT_2602769 [Pisolithus marmoratus]
MHLVVNELVLKALHHDTPDWHLKNTFPACMYTLKDEPNLKFKLLFAMDGNDSLKCISRAAIGSYESTEKDVEEQFIGDDHYLSQTFVNQFGMGCSDKSLMEPTADNDNPCTGRWKNMKEDVTSRMWGIFDKAGIFMAICRHGFSLVVMDIVQSGEQAKYLLAAVSKLLVTFGEGLAGYVDGMGLEDLEGCKHMFSKTNGFGISSITGYIVHNDKHEVYQNLTTMILNNYRQALHIVQEGKNTLPHLMDDLGIMDISVFRMWLLEENDLKRKHYKWNTGRSSSIWMQAGMSLFVQMDIAAMMRKETMCRHAMENFEKDLKVVQDLEVKLGMTKHWVPEDEEWQATGHLVANRKYQRCLDQLESLIVAWIFELSKMNQVGTGPQGTLSCHLHHA